MYVLKIVCLMSGEPTPFDGQFVKNYDPNHDGIDPIGRPMLALLETTSNASEAKTFERMVDAMEYWRQASTRWPFRPDGAPNRPLTAFLAMSEPLTEHAKCDQPTMWG